jgi:hypothetical protein
VARGGKLWEDKDTCVGLFKNTADRKGFSPKYSLCKRRFPIEYKKAKEEQWYPGYSTFTRKFSKNDHDQAKHNYDTNKAAQDKSARDKAAETLRWAKKAEADKLRQDADEIETKEIQKRLDKIREEGKREK